MKTGRTQGSPLQLPPVIFPSVSTLSPSVPSTCNDAVGASLRHALLVFIFAAASFSFSLGAAPLSGTEGPRAIPAHQMVQSGHYVIPTLYGYTYLKKPPLHY